jgi:hypothetical protein
MLQVTTSYTKRIQILSLEPNKAREIFKTIKLMKQTNPDQNHFLHLEIHGGFEFKNPIMKKTVLSVLRELPFSKITFRDEGLLIASEIRLILSAAEHCCETLSINYSMEDNIYKEIIHFLTHSHQIHHLEIHMFYNKFMFDHIKLTDCIEAYYNHYKVLEKEVSISLGFRPTARTVRVSNEGKHLTNRPLWKIFDSIKNFKTIHFENLRLNCEKAHHFGQWLSDPYVKVEFLYFFGRTGSGNLFANIPIIHKFFKKMRQNTSVKKLYLVNEEYDDQTMKILTVNMSKFSCLQALGIKLYQLNSLDCLIPLVDHPTLKALYFYCNLFLERAALIVKHQHDDNLQNMRRLEAKFPNLCLEEGRLLRGRKKKNYTTVEDFINWLPLLSKLNNSLAMPVYEKLQRRYTNLDGTMGDSIRFQLVKSLAATGHTFCQTNIIMNEN